MILITGASGNAGGAVLQAALARHLPVRAMYRNENEARTAPANVAPVTADYADSESLSRALRGVEAAFIVCGPIPQLIEFECSMIEACEAAGVRHVVLNSALGAGHFDKSFPSWHIQVERKLQSSRLAHTIVRPNGFMQNILAYNAATIRAQRAFYAAMDDAKISLIDVRDVGDAVAAILADPSKHIDQIYELNGPEALSNTEIAQHLSRATNADISYVNIPEAAQREAMLGAGMPEWQTTAVLELQQYYKTGACARIDNVVTDLTRKPPRTLDAYLTENAAAFLPTAS